MDNRLPLEGSTGLTVDVSGMSAGAVTVTREDLFERVWSTPMLQLAKEYSISDRGLAKICTRMEIPLPGRGYWRRVECNWKMKKPVLPPLSKVGKAMVIIREDIRERAPFPKSESHVEVSNELRSPHPLVKQARAIARTLDVPKGGFFYFSNQKALNIRCTRRTLKRALCIFDAVLKALEADGIVVKISSKGETVAICEGTEIGFAAEERSRRIEVADRNGNKRTEYPATGNLVFKINECLSEEFRKSWADGKKQRLENCLSEIIATIKFIAPKKAERERKWEEDRKASERAAKIRREEGEREERLKAELASWKQVKEIREYLAALDEEGSKECKDREFWIRWIAAYADLVDPTKAKYRGKPFELFRSWY